MPRYLAPHKSGVHRVACFALFRALLRQSSKLAIGKEEQSTLKDVVRKAFHKNSSLASNQKIVSLLEYGYESLKTLYYASSSPPQALLRLSTRLESLGTSRLRKPSLPIPRRSIPKPITINPVVIPWPGASPVLSRPYAIISGPRQVPKLISVANIPFLRFKKPQSPFLSRIIRDKIQTRQMRYNRLEELEALISEAAEEDTWDRILKVTCGIGMGYYEGYWVDELLQARQAVNSSLNRAQEANFKIAQKMQEIVAKETLLFEEEQQGEAH